MQYKQLTYLDEENEFYRSCDADSEQLYLDNYKGYFIRAFEFPEFPITDDFRLLENNILSKALNFPVQLGYTRKLLAELTDSFELPKEHSVYRQTILQKSVDAITLANDIREKYSLPTQYAFPNKNFETLLKSELLEERLKFPNVELNSRQSQ